jgi:uncharacterized protein
MELLLINIIVFGAGLVQGLTGFGSALVAMPLLLLLLPMKIVVPLVAVLSLSINMVNFLRTKKSFEFGKMGLLTLMSFIGIPLGTFLLKNIEGGLIRKVFGGVLILLALYMIKKPELKLKLSRGLEVVWGVVAGLIGGMFNVNGPLVVSYVNLRERDIDKRVNQLASYFLVTGVGVVLSHLKQGLWNKSMIDYLVLMVPMVMGGAFLGGWWQERADRQMLGWLTNGLIMMAGVGLLS